MALPSLRADLGLSLTGLEWVVTAYILAFSSLLLAGGRLADLLGRREALVGGVVVFCVASLLAGLSWSGPVLVAARVLQGVGAALVLPATLAILAADLPPEKRHLGAAVWTSAIAAALALGPLVGGAISEHLHWSWIFFLNLPVGLVAVVLGRRAVPPRRAPLAPGVLGRIDPLGLALSAVSLLGVTYALVQGHQHGFASLPILGALVVAAVAAVAFVLGQARSGDPLVDVALFRDRVFAGGTAAQILWGLGINGVFFFTSLFLQDVLALSPTSTGLAFLPLAVALVLSVPFVERLVALAGAALTVAAGMGLIAVGLVLVSRVGSDGGIWDLVPAFVLIGAGSGLTTPMTSCVLAVVPEDRAGVAAAVVSAAREVSGVFGIAVVGAILVAREASERAAGAGETAAFLAGYRTGLQVAAGLVVLGGLVSLLSLPGRTAERAAGPMPTAAP